VIRTNLERTHLEDRATIARAEAVAWLADPARSADGAVTLAVLDPPYDEPATLAAALQALGPLLAPNARVVAKHFWRDAPPPRVGLLASDRERRFGETALTFYRVEHTTEDA
jgi:16S rRNA G966 N2-methylase RsmD